MNRTAVAQLQFFDQSNSDSFQILFGTTEPHFLQGVFGGIDRSARAEQPQQQRLNFFRVTTTIQSRETRRPEVSIAATWNSNIDRNAADEQRTIIKSVGFISGSVL